MKKRIVSSLLCLCMALSLLPGTGLAAEAPEGGDGIVLSARTEEASLSAQAEESAVALADARVLSPSFRIDLADASACRYHHGSNLSTFTASDLENGNSPYDPSNGGTISVTNSGSSATFKFKERAHFKNADYLLQPFTISVEVPAYTAYTVTFDVDVSLVRNAKGSTWYFLEMTDNTDGAAYTATYSGGENTTMYGSSYFRCFGNGSSYKPSVHVTLTFMNNTDASKEVTRDFAFLLGNSRSGSLLTSYHHQLETTVTFSATSIEPSEYVAVVGESGTGVGQMYKTLDEAVAAYNASNEPALGLLRDASTSSPLTLAKAGTVDLDGHTLTLSGPSAGLVAAAGATVDIIGDSTTKGTLAAAGASTAISGAGAVRLSNLTISGAACGVNASGGVTLGNSVAFTNCTRDIYLKNGAAITLATNALSDTAQLKVAVENIRAATYDSPVAIVSNWSAAMSGKNPAAYLTVEGCQTLRVVNGALAAKPYRLTFDANGGVAAVTTADSDLTGRVSGVPDPTRTNYTFAGWYTAKTGGIQVNLTTGANLAGDVTLYAHWTADPITVKLDPGEGSLGDSAGTLTVTPGETYTGLPTPIRDNYTFLGWYTVANGGGSKVEDGSAVTNTSDHTLYAFWQRDTVTITFAANGGSPDSSRLLNKGDALGDLPEPSRTGYKFEGWYTEKEGGEAVTAETKPSASATYYAHWTADKYIVTLEASGGTLAEGDIGTLTVTYGGTYDGLPDALTRDYYTFTGWYTAPTGGEKVESGMTVTRAANHTLYARWSRDTYTVTFDSNGGSEVPSRPVNAGDALGTLPTPTKAGYTFEGWYSGDELITAETVPAGAVTYTAKWKIIEYTIPVNGTNQTITVEQPYSTILTETPTPQDGYTFFSWQDEKGNPIDPTKNPGPSNIPSAITPKWAANTYTVTFVADGGTVSSRSVTYGQPYGTLPTASKEGYDFVGWKLDNGTTVTAATTVTTAYNHTLTAQFAQQHTHSSAKQRAADTVERMWWCLVN